VKEALESPEDTITWEFLKRELDDNKGISDG
jgi:hypothetical protein